MKKKYLVILSALAVILAAAVIIMHFSSPEMESEIQPEDTAETVIENNDQKDEPDIKETEAAEEPEEPEELSETADDEPEPLIIDNNGTLEIEVPVDEETFGE